MSDGIGNYLRELRADKRYTTQQLAQKAGIRRTTLGDWQSGKRQPRMLELDAVLNAVGATDAQKHKARELLRTPTQIMRLREETAEKHRELVDVAGTAPHGGDLLRAMRMRKGWTQTTLAEKMGVSQATVVRWERAERWLDTESLHTLCYLLGAREEELTALTVGRFTLEGQPSTLTSEDIRDQLQSYRGAWYSPSDYGLADLRLLSLIAHAWSLSRHSHDGRHWLAVIYGDYAEHLYMQHRFAECRDAAMRALDIHSGLQWKDRYIDRTAIRLAGAYAMQGSQHGWDNAFSVLKQWLPHASLPVYKGWILREMAQLKAVQGKMEEAISLGRASVQQTENFPGSYDYLHRRHDFARLLVQVGRAQEAQEFAEESIQHPFFMLVQAEIYYGMGEWATGQRLVKEIVDIIEQPAEVMTQPEVAYYRPAVENLAEKLEGGESK